MGTEGGLKAEGGEVIRELKHNCASVCVCGGGGRHSDGENPIKGDECPFVLPARMIQELLPIRSLSPSLSLSPVAKHWPYFRKHTHTHTHTQNYTR